MQTTKNSSAVSPILNPTLPFEAIITKSWQKPEHKSPKIELQTLMDSFEWEHKTSNFMSQFEIVVQTSKIS